jgi:hypothetical protein
LREKQSENWRKLDMEEEPVGITSMAWFDDKLWLGAQHGLFIRDDETINKFIFPDRHHCVVGDIQLSAYDNALLVYNDPAQWFLIK